MARINLLPWRVERRERRKREFFTQLVIAGIAAVVVVALWGFWMNIRVGNQNSRNAYLKSQIQQLDAKISEIKDLKKVKHHLLARKKIVEKLQSSRSQMVHLFDQIVKTIPSGARLTSLAQKGDTLTLNGVAQSNATVAEYMRNIQASPWMGAVHLVRTDNVHNKSNMPYEFQLVVTLATPKNDGKADGPASGSSAAPPASVEVAVAASVQPSITLAKAGSVAPALPPAVATADPATSAAPEQPRRTSASVKPASVPGKADKSAPAASSAKGGVGP